MKDPVSLFRERDFRLIFMGGTLASLGASVSQLALPLTAVKLLNAGPLEMGLLGAAELLPFALFGLPAGTWIDRSYKRRMAMRFDLLAVFALALVPLAYLAGRLSMNVLFVAGFLVGCCHAIGGSAMQVFVAQLVGRDRLVEANAKIIAAESVSSVLGPALAAALIGVIGPPLAVTATACGFFFSFLALSQIKRDDPPSTENRIAWWHEAREGLRFVWSSPILRGMSIVGALWVMLFDGFRTLYVLFATKDLLLSPGQIAIANAIGAAGALIGAQAARRVEAHLGPRPGLIGGYLLSAIGVGLFAACAGLAAAGVPAVISVGLALLVLDMGATLYVVNYLSLRQKITPDPMMGRMTATMRFLTVAAAPLGALSAGSGGERFGLEGTLFVIAALGVVLALAAARWLPTVAKNVSAYGEAPTR
jgi:Na+/melibiose symporter-like transporter